MEIQDELGTLRRGVRDLVALTSLPAVWAGSQPQTIAESLSDVLMATLRLDLVYVCLTQRAGEGPLEIARTEKQLIEGQQAQEIGKVFAPLVKPEAYNQVQSVADPLGNGPIQIAVIPFGHD